MKISEEIKTWRSEMNLTQLEFALLIWPDKDPEMTRSYISHYESGDWHPRFRTYFRIKRIYDGYRMESQ